MAYYVLMCHKTAHSPEADLLGHDAFVVVVVVDAFV